MARPVPSRRERETRGTRERRGRDEGGLPGGHRRGEAEGAEEPVDPEKWPGAVAEGAEGPVEPEKRPGAVAEGAEGPVEPAECPGAIAEGAEGLVELAGPAECPGVVARGQDCSRLGQAGSYPSSMPNISVFCNNRIS